MKKPIILFSCLLLACSVLSGCSSKAGTGIAPDTSVSSDTKEPVSLNTVSGSPFLKSEKLELSEHLDSIRNITRVNGKTYISGYHFSSVTSEIVIYETDSETIKYTRPLSENEYCSLSGNKLYSVDYTTLILTVTDTSDTVSRKINLDKFGITEIESFLIADSGNAVITDQSGMIYIINYDDLNCSSYDISEYTAENYCFTADSNDNIYIFSNDEQKKTLYKLNSSSELIYSNSDFADLPGYISDITINENGKLSLISIDSSQFYINIADPETGKTMIREDVKSINDMPEIYDYQTDFAYSEEKNAYLIGTSSGNDTVWIHYTEPENYYCTLTIDENNNITDKVILESEYENNIRNITVSDNGDIVYIEENFFAEYSGLENNDDNKHIIRKISPDGTVSSFEVPVYTNELYPWSIDTDSSGNIYLTEQSYDSVCISKYDKDGNNIFSKVHDSMLSYNNCTVVNDTYYISCVDGSEKNVLLSADPEGNMTKCSENTRFSKIYRGNEKYDLLVSDGISLYGYSFSSDEFTELFRFVNCGLNSAPENICICPEKYILVLGNELYTLNPSDTESSKTVVKIASLGMQHSIQERIISFNSENDKYIIECIDYDYNDPDSETKFNLDIISGNIDMVLFYDNSYFNAEKYSRNIFADLNEFIENDPEYNKDDYFQNIIDLYSIENKLYKLTTSFSIYSLVNKSETTGSISSVSPEKFIKDIPEFHESLYGFTCCVLSSYIQQKDFTDETFRKLLEYLKENVYDISDGEKFPVGFSDAEDYAPSEYTASIMTKSMFQNNTNTDYIGFPSVNKNGIIAESIDSISILENSKNKQGSWEFIKYLLSEEHQDTIFIGIPVRRSSFEKVFNCEKAVKEQCLNVIEKADCRSLSTTDLFSIIWEDIELYYNDIKTLDETVTSIKQKTSLYFDELNSCLF